MQSFRFRFDRHSCALALALCGAVGCSRLLPGRRAAVVVPVSAGPTGDAPTVQYLGTVHVIGTDGRFVLVQSPAAGLVAGLVDGQTLLCRASDSVTATLHVSRERRQPFVVADVVTGTPGLGDEVFIESAGNKRASPTPAALPSPTPELFRANPPLPSAR